MPEPAAAVEADQSGGDAFLPGCVQAARGDKKLARLLLVEDSDVNQEIMQKMLSKLGYSADMAENGRAAIEAATHEDYGLILMDLHLPDISGIEAIEAIRAQSGARANTAIAVLTAGASDEEMARCRALKVNDFLTKPLDSKILADTLKHYRITSTSVTKDAPSSGTSENTAPDSMLVEIFIKEATQRLDSLRKAVASNDAQRAAREAHTLKSSSAYFHADAMHDAAARLEEMADSGQLSKAKPELEKLEAAYARLHANLTKDKN